MVYKEEYSCVNRYFLKMLVFKGFCCLIFCCSVLIPLYETIPLVEGSSSVYNVQKAVSDKVNETLAYKFHENAKPTGKISKPYYPQRSTSKTETKTESVKDNSTERIIDLNFRSFPLKDNTSNSFPELEGLTTANRSTNTGGSATENFPESTMKSIYTNNERKLGYTTIEENTGTVHSIGNITGDGLIHPDISALNRNILTDASFQNNSESVDSTNESKGDNYHVATPSQDAPRETSTKNVSADVWKNGSNLHNISSLLGDTDYISFKSNTGKSNYSADGIDQMINDMENMKVQNEQPPATAETELAVILLKFTATLSNASDESMDINLHNSTSSNQQRSAKVKNESGTTGTGLMLRRHEITNDKISPQNGSDTGKSYELSSNNKTDRHNESMGISGSVNHSGELTDNKENAGQVAEEEVTSKANFQSASHNHSANSTVTDSEPLTQNNGPQQNESQEAPLKSSTVEAYFPEKVNGTLDGQLSNTPKTNLTSISQTPKEISKLESSEPPVISEGQPSNTLKKTLMSQTPGESKFEDTQPNITAEEHLGAIPTIPDSIIIVF